MSLLICVNINNIINGRIPLYQCKFNPYSVLSKHKLYIRTDANFILQCISALKT